MIRREYQGLLDKVKEQTQNENDEEEDNEVMKEVNKSVNQNSREQIRTREAFQTAFKKPKAIVTDTSNKDIKVAAGHVGQRYIRGGS